MNHLLSLHMKRGGVVLAVALLGLVLFGLAGCAGELSGVPMSERWSSIEGGRLQVIEAGEEFPFEVRVDESMIATGVPVTIKVSGDVSSGWLRFELRAPGGEAVWDSGTINPGDFAITGEYSPLAGTAGTYKLGMVYGPNTEATYNLGWQALRLGPLVLLPGVGMILIGLGFVGYAARKRLLGWRYLGLGALFWALTVAVKFAVAIPLNPVVFRLLGVSYERLFAPGNLIAYLYIGALTGVFEVGLTWLVLSRAHWGKATWPQALVFGIGFGVVEALLLGLLGFGSALAALLGTEALPISVLGGLAGNATLAMGLAPVVERLAVILAHIFACVLIFYAIGRGEAKWGWLAIGYKTLLDAVAGFANFWGVSTLSKIWTMEAILVVLGLIALWGARRIELRYRQLPVEAQGESQDVLSV